MARIADTTQLLDGGADRWLRAIGGAARLGALQHQTLDGIAISPLSGPAAIAGRYARAETAAWDIRALHGAGDPALMKKAIAEDLADGATSIAIKLATPGDFGLPPRYDAIATALQGVPLNQVDVTLLCGDQYFGAAQTMLALFEATGRSGYELRAGVLADPLGTLARTGALETGLWPALELLGQFVAANVEPWPHVRLLLADAALYHDAGASEAQELAAMLATVVEYARVLDFDGVTAADLFAHVTIKLAADCDQFATIAKLRAARAVIARLADSLGVPDAAGEVRLWAVTSQRMLTARALHTNVLRNSIAAFSAAIGGADAITVLPHDWAVGAASAYSRRLARNTHLLLARESGLARVLDPGAGSGSIEALTDALARRAWALFQEIEAGGGMAKALLAGRIQTAIVEMAARREKLLADGELTITSVTAFAASIDAAEPTCAHPDVAPIERAETRVPALPVRRLSAQGEKHDR